MRVSTLMPTTITAALILLLVFSSLHYETAYSQLNNNILGSNFSSLMKNLLGPQKQVSGHYSNPQFGIADIVFPDGWSGREMPPILGLSVIMHPGSENQSSSSLFGMSSIPFAQPLMMMQVVNNSDVAALSSEIGNPQAFSISKVCKPLAQNTTSVIDGRTFNVATIECPLSSLRAQGEGGSMPSMGTSNQSNFGTANGGKLGGGLFRSLNLNPNAIMQAKFYELKTPDKTYRLGLIVSNLFSSQTSEKPDISKYTQLLDTTANTLKFR